MLFTTALHVSLALNTLASVKKMAGKFESKFQDERSTFFFSNPIVVKQFFNFLKILLMNSYMIQMKVDF